MQAYNTAAVSPQKHPLPHDVLELAETIAAYSDPEDQDFDAELAINDEVMEILDPDQYLEYQGYDCDPREFYRLGNGKIGVYWRHAQIVEGGLAREIAEKWVSEFRRHQED